MSQGRFLFVRDTVPPKTFMFIVFSCPMNLRGLFIGGSQKCGLQKGWFWRMVPRTKTKTGTRVRSHVPPERKTGTRVHSPKPPLSPLEFSYLVREIAGMACIEAEVGAHKFALRATGLILLFQHCCVNSIKGFPRASILPLPDWASLRFLGWRARCSPRRVLVARKRAEYCFESTVSEQRTH